MTEKNEFIASIFQESKSTSQRKINIEEIFSDSKEDVLEIEKINKSEPNKNEPTMLEMMMTAQAEANKQQKEIKRQVEKNSIKEFGDGFKKGFLGGRTDFKENPNSKHPYQDDEVSKIIDVKPTSSVDKSNKSNLVFNDVQEAMNNPILTQLQSGEWVSEDLITSMKKNKTLEKGFKNRKCMEAIELMKSNPHEAKRRFANDEEVSNFMKEFGEVMSKHFTDLGNTKESSNTSSASVIVPKQSISDVTVTQAKVKDIQEIGPLHAQVLKQKNNFAYAPDDNTEETERRVNEVLEDSELRNLLLDVKFQEILQDCNDPVKFRLHMQNKETARKIKKMYDAGLVGTTK